MSNANNNLALTVLASPHTWHALLMRIIATIMYNKEGNYIRILSFKTLSQIFKSS